MQTILLTSGRTGSQLIVQSLIDAGIKAALEPLHHKPEFNLYKKYLTCDPSEISILPNEGKIAIIDRVMTDHILCKILYFQTNPDMIRELSKKYQFVHLVRNPFDVFISFKMAALKGKWHTKSESDIVQPKEPVVLDEKEMTYFINSYIIGGKAIYGPLCSYEFDYQETIDNWDGLMVNLFQIMNIPFSPVKKTILKNQENPRDFISNYDDLKAKYLQFQ